MIDFTSCEVNKFKAYGGANGNKIHVTYDGNGYMLKFPPIPGRNKNMSYSNVIFNQGIADLKLVDNSNYNVNFFKNIYSLQLYTFMGELIFSC